MTREEAVARLRASVEPVVTALASLDETRASTQGVQFPFGMLLLYQFGDFIAAHVARHHQHLERATGGVTSS